MSGSIPAPVIPATALLAMTVVMTGLGIAPRQLRWLWQRPGPLLRSLLAVFVVVTAIAILPYFIRRRRAERTA